MNAHAWLDTAALAAGSLYGDSVKFFREGTDSESLFRVARRTTAEFSGGMTCGEYHIPVTCSSQEGTARFSLISYQDPRLPLLIFCHGSGEHDYTRRIKRILPDRMRAKFNLAAISIPCNRNLKEYLHGIGSLERFCFLIASSVAVAEQVRIFYQSKGASRVILSGISLGGWVTNLHAALHGTMDEYRPICAGAALDDLFTSSEYRKMAARKVKGQEVRLYEVLNFEREFSDCDRTHVHPLLARYDQYIRYERKKVCYLPKKVRIIDKGNGTTAMDYRALQEFLLEAVK